MLTCDETANLVLDFLYELLEEDDARQLREHLGACPACRAALAAAEAQQHLLARAAQIYAEVPAFTAPSAEPSVPTEAPRPVPVEVALAAPAPAPAPPEVAPATLPLKPRAKRPRILRWLTAAAILLLGAGGAFGVVQYQRGLIQRQEDLGRARREVSDVEVRLAQAERTYVAGKGALPAALKNDYLQIEVYGPANYRRDAASRYRVAVRDLDGKPVAATMTARLRQPARPQPVYERDTAIQGDGALTLPAGLDLPSGSLPYLQVEARRGPAQGPPLGAVEEMLRTAAPAYVTHLALSKAVHRVGDILFFRSLTVERFSLVPAQGAFEIAATLVGPNGQSVRTLSAVARDGVAGGEIALTGELPVGEYTLRIEDRDSAKPRFLPESRRLTVVREESPQLQLDRSLYTTGDTVNAAFRAGLQNGTVVPNQPITVEADLAGKSLPLTGAAPGKPLQMRTDNFGRADFQLPLPTMLPALGKVRMKVQVHDGKRNEKVEVAVPIFPQPAGAGALNVELFPEGGDLVAGVPNRVYFQVRDQHGRPAALTGVVLDRQGRAVVPVNTVATPEGAGRISGLGVFALTPEAGEVYTLRAGAPGKAETRIALPQARTDGVALSVPEGVSREGQPLRVAVRDPLGRRLLVLAECRGRIVDQKLTTADKAGGEVTLAPVAGTRGVVRVMVCAVSAGRLLPLAERLVYRIPAEYLQIAVTDRTGKEARMHSQAGEHFDLTVKVTTEKGKAVQASLLAAFVDRKWLAAPGQRAEVSPPAHFYLSRAVRHPEDLEDVDILLADTAQPGGDKQRRAEEARQALDLFLGTHGWRRFVPQGEQEQIAAGDKRKAAAAGRLVEPAVLIADNRAGVRADYRAALDRRENQLLLQAEQRRAELKGERDAKLEEAGLAAGALHRYEKLSRENLLGGLVAVILLLFAVGSLFLAVGVARMVRGAGSPRGSFGAAFAALALCVGAYFLTANLHDGQGDGRGPVASVAPKALPPLVDARGELTQEGQEQRHPQARSRRLFALVGEKRAAPARDSLRSQDAAATNGSEAKKAPIALSSSAAPSPPAARTDVNRELGGNNGQRGGQEFRRRFGELERTQQQLAQPFRSPGAGAGQVAPGKGGLTFVPSGSLPSGFGGDGKKDAAKAKAATAPSTHLLLRAYRHKQDAGALDFQDTLFWHPALQARDGTAHLEFDLSSNVATYQLLLYGHSPSGRLGVYRGTVETRK